MCSIASYRKDPIKNCRNLTARHHRQAFIWRHMVTLTMISPSDKVWIANYALMMSSMTLSDDSPTFWGLRAKSCSDIEIFWKSLHFATICINEVISYQSISQSMNQTPIAPISSGMLVFVEEGPHRRDPSCNFILESSIIHQNVITTVISSSCVSTNKCLHVSASFYAVSCYFGILKYAQNPFKREK